MTTPVSFAALLERFFTQRLMQQRQASPHTISSYRDTFRQFLKFVQQWLHKAPSQLNFEEIDAPLIVAFLDGLEKEGLSVRSRNLRLTALHSFFATRRSRSLTTLHRSSVCLPFPASVSHGHWSSFSPVRKSMLCSPHPIKALGSADAITRFFSWPSRRACAYPR